MIADHEQRSFFSTVVVKVPPPQLLIARIRPPFEFQREADGGAVRLYLRCVFQVKHRGNSPYGHASKHLVRDDEYEIKMRSPDSIATQKTIVEDPIPELVQT